MKRVFNSPYRNLPLLFLLLAGGQASATTLAQTLRAAESYSAELSANSHQTDALENMADSAGQLPDPKLKFGIENVPVQGGNAHRFTREGMTMQRVGVMQEYVSSSKRERKADAIRAQAQQNAAGADVIRAQLQREAAQAWFDLALSQKTLASVEQLIAETRRQVNTQLAAVSSGSATADSVLDVKLAINDMQNEADNASRDVQIASAKLTQLTGENISEISGTFPPVERLPADENSLLAAISQHPEIIQAARSADSAKARSAQSAVAAIPDVGVEVYYGKRGDGMDDMAGVMFTVDLPISQHSRQDKDHAADQARTWEANDQLTQLIRQHQAQLSGLIASYNAAKDIYERQNNQVLPLLRNKIALLNGQYQAGNSSLSELLAARRQLLNGLVAANNAEKSLASAWVSIRYLVPQDVKS